jgi:DHA2 family multidrug resistance protein
MVAEHPIVELRVLKNGNLRIGTALSFVLGFGLYGSTFIIPLYTQSILGWTPLQAGELMIPAAIMTAFTMPFVGRILTKGAPPQVMVAGGMLLFAVFSIWCYAILTPSTSGDDFFWPLIVRGLGMGLLFIPITALSLSSLRGQEIGQGAAFTGMMRQLGGSFGISVITTLIARQNSVHRMDMLPRLSNTNPAFTGRVNGIQAALMSKGKSAEEALAAAYRAIEGAVMKQAAVLSYMDIFMWLGAMFILFVPVMLLVKQRKAKLDMAAMAEASH